MSCIICGKENEITSVLAVKYASQTTLPEVLTAVIGTKIASEDWNDGSQHICSSCNLKCEEYDKLDSKLQDLKEALLQEYTRRVYREASGAAPPFRRIRLRARGAEGAGGDEGGRGKDGDKGEEGAGRGAEKNATGSTAPVKDEAAEEGTQAAELARGGVSMTIEGQDSSTTEGQDSATIEGQDSATTEGQDDASEPDKEDRLTGVTRVAEKADLRRLPDYEYEQWYTLDGYCYVLKSQTARGQVLACHKGGCRTTVRVAEGPLLRVTGEHTHEPDRRIPERNKLYGKLKERCMEDQTTVLRTIYDEEAKKFPGGASYLPFPEVRMREWRASKDPTVTIHTDVSSLEEMGKKYQCDVCNMGFNSSRLLLRHSRQHERSVSPDDGAPKRRDFASPRGAPAKKMKMNTSTPIVAVDKKLKKSLDKKMKRVLQKLQGVTAKTPPTKAKEDEATEEEERGRACHVCNRRTDTLKQLKAHIVAEHGDVLMCVHCDIAFDTPRLLKRHITFCRMCRDERKNAKPKKEERPELAVEDDELTRELSRITGQDAGEIEDEDNDPNWDASQSQEDDDDEDDDDDEWHKEGNNGQKLPKMKKKRLKCEVCPMSFPTTQQLRQHLYTHSSVKQFGCPRCPETFGKKAMLTRHMIAEKHSGQIKMKAPCIDRTLWNESSGIRFQWGSIADATKYYECAVCSDTFNTERTLITHMKEKKHISDQMIIHERRAKEQVVKKPEVKSSSPVRNRHCAKADEYRSYPRLDATGPIVIGGLKFRSKQQAMEAWYRVSGKKPVECAVCGAGFDNRTRLLAHMEREEHLTDSIVENVPEPDEMGAAARGGAGELAVKQEPARVEILSQVIIAPEEQQMKEEKEEEREQTYYIQTENVNGETVMVIQGDLDGSLHENMQLYMDEEGNIVTQDEEGNTIKVMQVDLSKVQQVQQQAEEETDQYIGLEEPSEAADEAGQDDTDAPLLEDIQESEDKTGLVREANIEGESEENVGVDEAADETEATAENDLETGTEEATENVEGAEQTDDMEGTGEAEENLEGTGEVEMEVEGIEEAGENAEGTGETETEGNDADDSEVPAVAEECEDKVEEPPQEKKARIDEKKEPPVQRKSMRNSEKTGATPQKSEEKDTSILGRLRRTRLPLK